MSWEARRASETTVPALPGGTTLADLTELLTGYGDGLNVPSGTPTSWLIPNLDAFADTFDIYCNCGTFALGDISVTAARGNNRSVEEEDQGVYLQADFSMDWGIPVRGNLGVRYVETQMTSQGYSHDGCAGGSRQRVRRRAAFAEPGGRAHARPAAARGRGQGDDAAGAGLGIARHQQHQPGRKSERQRRQPAARSDPRQDL